MGDSNASLTGEWFVPPAGSPRVGLPAEPVVGATRALRGRSGGPGFHPRRPDARTRRLTASQTPWQISHRLWTEAGIPWELRPAGGPYHPQAPERFPYRDPAAHRALPPQAPPPQALPPRAVPPPRAPMGSPPPPRNTPARPPRSGSVPSEAVSAAWPGPTRVPLGAPVFAEAQANVRADAQAGAPANPGLRADAQASPRASVQDDLTTEPASEPRPHDSWRTADRPPPPWDRQQEPGYRAIPTDTLLLEPELPGDWHPGPHRGLRRRTATIVVPVLVLVAVAVLALALLTGHGPKFGQLTAGQPGGQRGAQGTTAQSALTIGMYPGQQQRGVFQSIGRIVASGTTMVAIGSQVSDGVVRQQFFVSANSGASWRLAPVRSPGGGQPPLGYPAARLAGGPGGWLAVGSQAIWTSPDGTTWTLAATHGITPQLPGDQMMVLNSTAQGYLAAGLAPAGHGATQAVLWTSRDGLTWQRKTAADLGLAGPGETVLGIAYITTRGQDTLISGSVANGGATYSAVWLTTDGGATWTRVNVPSDHGASSWITGLGADGQGMVAVRPGLSATGAADGVVYFSPNGAGWQYAATIDAAGGWTPNVVKGSDYGFVVSGTTAAGQIVAYTSTGTGTAWQPTASLGPAAGQTVDGATVAPASTIIAVGASAASKVSRQPVFLEANTAGRVRPIPLASIPGATVPELAVNSLAIADGQQVAVGSANGYPAIWRKASGGSWALVSALSQVSAESAPQALTGIAHGSAGWLAVGAPGPVVFTSPDGNNWQAAGGPGSITDDLADPTVVSTAAGPAGYIIVGTIVKPGGGCLADVWWSPNLISWTRGHDVNDATGSSTIMAVAADAHGFVSVGSHNGEPAAWVTTNGRSWTTILLPLPAGSRSAVLQRIAISGNRVVALGQEATPAGPEPFAELSVDEGITWNQVPISAPGPDTTFSALTSRAGGFTAIGQFGQPGQQEIAAWTSANGTTWAQAQISGVTGGQTGGSYQITAVAPSGSTVTGIGSITTQQSQEIYTVALPAH